MEEALRFFVVYETWIYLILGGLALWEIRKFVISWEEVREAAFGMERESAQSRLNRAAIMLVLLLVMTISEFVLVSFVVPSVPGAFPLLTPTLDLLATQTQTLPPAAASAAAGAAETVPPPGTPAPAIAPTLEGSGCIPGQLMITQPENGANVEGKITLIGTVDLPNFGFYQYEVARPGDPIWLTIQAGREVKIEAPLGELDTRALPPGDMLLRLVATDNQGDVQATCTILIHVIAVTSP